MKKAIITIQFIGSFLALSQTDEMYLSEGHNTFQNNPASFGNQEQWSVNAFGQIQPTEFSGVPYSVNLNGGGSFSLTEASKHELILGATYMYRGDYFQDNQSTNLSLGYRYKFGKHSSFGVAVAPGIYDVSYNLFKPIITSTGNDTVFTSSNHDPKFDLNAGIMFNWKTLYAGISVTHLNGPALGHVPVTMPKTYHFQAGYKIPIKDFHIFPMVQWQKVDGFQRAQIMTYYVFKNNLFSAGLGFRGRNSILLGASFELNGLRIGYNLNPKTRSVENEPTSTHEFRLSYSFGSKKIAKN